MLMKYRFVTIARSHSLLSNPLNVLALLERAFELISLAKLNDQSGDIEMDSDIPRFELSQSHITKLMAEIGAMVRQYHALCQMDNLISQGDKFKPKYSSEPVVERLHLYPLSRATPGNKSNAGVDLANLVTYPLKCEPIPVKPIFLDLAYNHIEYPKNLDKQVKAPSGSEASKGKRSWFGFGRS